LKVVLSDISDISTLDVDHSNKSWLILLSKMLIYNGLKGYHENIVVV